MAERRRHLELELLEPGAVTLVRLFNEARVGQPGGEWEPPPWPDHEDRWSWAPDKAAQRLVVRYRFSAPALFIPIDHNDERLELAAHQRAFTGCAPYQVAAGKLFAKFGMLAHGLSWKSFHRNQPGRVYALWHHHKNTIKLEIASPVPYTRLPEDDEWKQFLAQNPAIEAVRS